jgi:hypothetical protein
VIFFSQLEKAVGYEQRRTIRAQIRVVRRLIAERRVLQQPSVGRRPELETREPDAEDWVPFDDDDSYQKPSSSPQSFYQETRQQTSSSSFRDSKQFISHTEQHSTFSRDSKSPDEIPDRKSSPVRKPSKTELNIELKPATASSGEYKSLNCCVETRDTCSWHMGNISAAIV